MIPIPDSAIESLAEKEMISTALFSISQFTINKTKASKKLVYDNLFTLQLSRLLQYLARNSHLKRYTK